MIFGRWFPLLAAVCGLFLGACSSFERDWKNATRAPLTQSVPKRHAAFAGAWDGQWTSEKHRLPSGPAGGRLRCIFTPVDDTHYRAQFHANWLCFATGYEVTFDTQRRGGVLTFGGSHDLGAIFGGVYRYDGRVTPAHFLANFASRYDYGRFEMRRPVGENAPAGGVSPASH